MLFQHDNLNWASHCIENGILVYLHFCSKAGGQKDFFIFNTFGQQGCIKQLCINNSSNLISWMCVYIVLHIKMKTFIHVFMRPGLLFFHHLFIKESWKKCISFHKNIKQHNCFVNWIIDNKTIFLSKSGSCDTEVMAAENSALHLRNKLHFKIYSNELF